MVNKDKQIWRALKIMHLLKIECRRNENKMSANFKTEISSKSTAEIDKFFFV